MAAPATQSDIVVMKFGGTSVAGAEQIKRAAARIVAAREAGKRVVAVLSARGKTTDELVAQALEISDRPVAREMDMLLSTDPARESAVASRLATSRRPPWGACGDAVPATGMSLVFGSTTPLLSARDGNP